MNKKITNWSLQWWAAWRDDCNPSPPCGRPLTEFPSKISFIGGGDIPDLPVFLFSFPPNATSSEQHKSLSNTHRHSCANNRTFQLNFCTFYPLSFSGEVHIILSQWNRSRQQKTEPFWRFLHVWFMLDGWARAAWFHLSSSSTHWHSNRGFPICDDSSIPYTHSLIYFTFTVLSVQCGLFVLSIDAVPNWMLSLHRGLCI